MFRRSSAGAADGKAQGSVGTQAPEAPARDKSPAQAGKGRPTPKRSQAEANRYRSISGSTTSGRGRGAPASGRKSTPEEKARAREERNKQLAAMRRGEDWALGARDRGPVKKLVRDHVDAHRRPSEFYLYALIFLVLVLFFGKSNHVISSDMEYVLIGIIAVLAVDAILLRRSVMRLVGERHPAESSRGLAYYSITRAMMIRRFRTPAPRIKPGDQY